MTPSADMHDSAFMPDGWLCKMGVSVLHILPRPDDSCVTLAKAV